MKFKNSVISSVYHQPLWQDDSADGKKKRKQWAKAKRRQEAADRKKKAGKLDGLAGKELFAAKMREKPTRGEARLLKLLAPLAHSHGLKFYPQRVVYGWIPDFYCPSRSLIVEVDGATHFTPEGIAADAIRDNAFAGNGIKTMRFRHSAVMRRDTDWILRTIVGEALARPHIPQPHNPSDPEPVRPRGVNQGRIDRMVKLQQKRDEKKKNFIKGW